MYGCVSPKASSMICRIMTALKERLCKDFMKIFRQEALLSAYALDRQGIAAAVSKMAFGNQMGVKIEQNVDERDLFGAGFGDIICEVAEGKVGELAMTYTLIGEVTDRASMEYKDMSISMAEALETWTGAAGKSV